MNSLRWLAALGFAAVLGLTLYSITQGPMDGHGEVAPPSLGTPGEFGLTASPNLASIESTKTVEGGRSDATPSARGRKTSLGAPALRVSGVVRVVDGAGLGEPVRVRCTPLEGLTPRPDRAFFADVQEDGSFPVPRDSPWPLMLDLEAEFLGLKSPLSLDAAPEDDTIVLEAHRGGRLTVEFTGSGAGHAGAVLGDTFAVFGADIPYRTASRGHSPSDEDGTLTFFGVRPEAVRWVGLEADLFIDSLVPVPLFAVGERASIELPVVLGVTASGAILGPDKAPVPGARVRLGSWERPDMQTSIGFDEETVTDDEGRFVVGGVLAGEMTLRVTKEGFESAVQSLGPRNDGDRVDDVEVSLAGGGVVSGLVLWPDGTPAPKAVVRLAPVGRDWKDGPTVKTDAEGKFEFSGLTGTRYRLVASSKKKRSKTRWRAQGTAGTGDRIELELSAGITLAGTATDDRGVPLEEFSVTATAVGIDRGADRATDRVRKGDGSFELVGMEAGTFDVTVTAKGHTPARKVRVTVPDSSAQVNFVLDRLGSAAGKAVDGAGSPLPGIALFVGGRAVTTDEEGRFRVEGVDPGALLVKLGQTTPGVLRSDPVQLDPGDVREDVVIVIGQGATVRCVLHPSVAAGIYDGATLRQENTFSIRSAECDEDGVAVFTGLDAGTYWAALPSVQGREWVDTHRDTCPVPLEVVENATVTVTVGAPDAYPITVAGRVTRGGEAQSGLLIYVYWQGPERTFPAAIGRTGDDGRYELALRAAGAYTFNIGEGQMAQARFLVELAEDASQVRDFDLPDRELRGRATYGDGTPVVGRTYVLVHGDAPRDTKQAGDLQFAGTRSDGTFRFTGLHPGSYRLHTGNYFAAHDTDGVLIVEGIDIPAEGEAEEVSVVIPRAATLTVRAVDADGHPLGDHVANLETNRGSPHLIYQQDKTDSQGYQRLTGIGPGPWRIEIQDPRGTLVGEGAVRLTEGELKELTVICQQ